MLVFMAGMEGLGLGGGTAVAVAEEGAGGTGAEVVEAGRGATAGGAPPRGELPRELCLALALGLPPRAAPGEEGPLPRLPGPGEALALAGETAELP